MTKEELIKKIYAEIAKLSDNASQMCEEYEGYRLACQDISDVLHEITKEIQPSLPSDIDETAKSCLKEALQKFYDTIGKPYALVNESEVDEFGEFLFRAGAVWMAGQGVTCEGKVFTSAFTSYVKTPGIEELLKDAFPEDTEVIVQIRKKQ